MHNINRKQNRCPETDDTDINHSTKKFHTREGWYTGGSGSGSGGGSGATRLSTYACAHVSSRNGAEVAQLAIAINTCPFTHVRVIWEGSSSDKLYNSVFSGINGQIALLFVKSFLQESRLNPTDLYVYGNNYAQMCENGCTR